MKQISKILLTHIYSQIILREKNIKAKNKSLIFIECVVTLLKQVIICLFMLDITICVPILLIF